MKILLTLGYLVVFIFFIYVAKKQQEHQMQQVGGSSGNALWGFLLQILMLVTVFAQFWILTGFFSYPLILLLIAAFTVGAGIYFIIGGIAGFTLKEKQKKIGALAVIGGAQKPVIGCVFMLTSLLITIVTVIGNLWLFWSHPYGDPKALVWIAFFQFVLPQIVIVPFSIILLWPIVISEYMDDDLRNSYLASSFSNIIYRTIYLLFPLWLFEREIVEVFHLNLPSFWTLLSIPLLLFLFGSLLPFFIGIYRFRSQARLMIAWREKWLRDVLELVKLPEGDLRIDSIDEKLDQLREEITMRFSQNKLFHFYQELVSPDIDNDTLPLPQAESPPALPQPDDTLDPVADSQLEHINETFEIRRSIHTAKEFLTQRVPSRDVGKDLVDNVYQIVQQNRSNLVDWDIRFEHLFKLLQLYEIGLEGRTKDISGFIDARLEKLSSAVAGLTSRRNLLAGSIMTCVSSAIVWLFKTFQTDIMNFIGRLVQI